MIDQDEELSWDDGGTFFLWLTHHYGPWYIEKERERDSIIYLRGSGNQKVLEGKLED